MLRQAMAALDRLHRLPTSRASAPSARRTPPRDTATAAGVAAPATNAGASPSNPVTTHPRGTATTRSRAARSKPTLHPR